MARLRRLGPMLSAVGHIHHSSCVNVNIKFILPWTPGILRCELGTGEGRRNECRNIFVMRVTIRDQNKDTKCLPGKGKTEMKKRKRNQSGNK
jgi:hypothetical protein